MITPFRKYAAVAAILAAAVLGNPPSAQASGYPVVDVAHISQTVYNGVTETLHKVEDGIAWASDYMEQKLQNLTLLNQLQQLFTTFNLMKDEIYEAAGTLADIAQLPTTILDEIQSFVGSIQQNIMEVAGVGNIFGSIQDTFSVISKAEALGNSFGGNMDFGDFGNAYGMYSSLRGVQNSTAIQYLKDIPQSRQPIRRIINTLESPSNQSQVKISKASGQIAAAQLAEVQKQNEFAAIGIQRQNAESIAREEAARARASRSQSQAITILMEDDF